MRYYLITIFLLSVNLFTVRAQFSDDFSDGDFTTSPSWSGSTSEFIVNGSQQLQLNNAGLASLSFLSSANSLTNLDSIEWQFYIRQGFSPSANNNGRVYLVSDQTDLTGPLNGYYLQFGESGSLDAVELFEQSGTTSSSVCRASDAMIAGSFEIRIKVTRDHLGSWELWIDYSGGNNFVLEATGNDLTHTSSNFIGVTCLYTASNGTNFYFDDFYNGSYLLDTVPPELVSVSPVSSTQLDVYYNESVSLTTAQNTASYTVDNGIGTPLTAIRDATDFSLVHLTFATSFINGINYNISISGVEDSSGNVMIPVVEPFLFFVPVSAQFKDVIINEIFADPAPQIGLPDKEFIEIYNNSANIFDLNGWEITDGSSLGTISSYLFQPDSYLILCAPADTAAFGVFGETLGVSGFPSLNNAGDHLELTDGTVGIDEVDYEDSWYRDAVKGDGGYSLELINPSIPCTDKSNWIGSESSIGGTPGTQNSVFDNSPDLSPPVVTTAFVYSSDSIKVIFSEALDQTALGSIIITISNGLGFTESLDNTDFSCLWIQTNPSMTTGDSFSLTIEGLQDCSGNVMTTTIIYLNVPEQADPGDVVINEILFNPTTGGSDFVELYNRSNKWISLQNWSLANWEDGISNPTTLNSLLILSPGEYLAISADTQKVKDSYPFYAGTMYYQTSSFPSYNNDSGTVYIVSDQNEICDQFSYNEDQHFALLNNVEGVSLERIDFNRPSSDNTNWHSAAENIGYATPGAVNSQYLSTAGNGKISIDPEVFSPDNDGFQDVVNISYELDGQGKVGKMAIYDAHGRLVRWLLQNELLSTEGTISWDGITESGEKALMGVYVIYFEVFDLGGTVSKYKLPVVVGGRL